MSKKDDILLLLVIPINICYYYFYKYLLNFSSNTSIRAVKD